MPHVIPQFNPPVEAATTVSWPGGVQNTHSARIGSNLGFTQLARRDSGNFDMEDVNSKVEMIILAQGYLPTCLNL